MKKLHVYFKENFAGTLTKASETRYEFKYDKNYLTHSSAREISVNLPLQTEPFTSEKLFPYFDNLISEGWLLDIQARERNINKEARFELVEEYGVECLGAVSLRRADD